MRELPATAYGPGVQALLERARREARPPTLPMGEPATDAFEAIQGLDEAKLAGKPARSPDDGRCVLAGLWLLFEGFEQSHTLSQAVNTPEGSYWHAILHRREPDASNARYWFARVGAHPIFPELLQDARELARKHPQADLKGLLEGPAWDPDEFVLRCTREPRGETEAALLELQRREWELLFEHSFKRAFGA
ncbi:MAG: hypothetical protein M5U26_22380 [Planctomycetota bacterium]|nr:hypothetical protein [Planctomycetota bacterium]